MPVPKGKRSRARRDKRFANKNIAMGPVGACQTCQTPIASHQICQSCGYYKGVKVIRTKAERAQERGQARAAANAHMQQQHATDAPVDAAGE